MTLEDDKRRLREELLARRADAADRPDPDAGARIRDHFLAAGLAPPVGTVVSGYWPYPGEADVRPLLEALAERGAALALPVVTAKGAPLIFRAWTPGEPLVEAAFGLSVPPPEAPERTPALVLAPLLAVDGSGNRLGHGAGFYDRTLAGLRAAGELTVVGIALAWQQVDSVPTGQFDQPLDWVVTDAGAARCTPEKRD